MSEREDARLAALDGYDILDTPSEESFDRVTRLARRLFDVPMATIAFLDGHREWFKSRQGLDIEEVSRQPTICNIAIRQPEPLIIPDTHRDDRVRDNIYVTGEPYLRFYAGIPLAAPDGSNVGIICVMDTKPRAFDEADREALVDLGRLVMTELELRTVASTDALTGLMSRRAFMTEGERTIALATRHRMPLTCVTFDLDNFKTINDTHGHAGGDAVLRETARTCRAALRSSDLIGRLGGEEFGVLLPYTPGATATDVAEKLRAAIAAQRIVGADGEPIAVTASFGLATFDRASPTLRDLLAHADAALYDAKRAGRDQWKQWQPPADVATAQGRRRVLKAGRISFNFGRSAIDCTVRSLSYQGAGIDVSSTAGVPDLFKLRIDSDDLSVPCKVVAKQERHLEVAFA